MCQSVCTYEVDVSVCVRTYEVGVSVCVYIRMR